jgi:hypothetical protein
VSILRDPRAWTKLRHLAAAYPAALWGAWRERTVLRPIETTCLFLGHPRSAHSLVGALLDAHPDAVVAHEADILKYVFAGFGRRQLQYLMLQNSRAHAQAGRTWEGYSYRVPGQWQGRSRVLRVIGDKHAESTTVRLMLVPGLFERVHRVLGPRIRFIHVVRNPYDNIATIAAKGTHLLSDHVFERTSDPVHDSTAFYFALCDGILRLAPLLGDRLLTVRHEEFSASPREVLRRICGFLELEPAEDYLDACAAIVHPTPHLSRHEIAWTEEQRATVGARAARVPFLDGYRFDV